jgi:hypothetical protein
MSRNRLLQRSLIGTLAAVLAFTAAPQAAETQLGKGLLMGGVCAGMGVLGFKAGEKMAEFEAKKLKLNPAEAEKHRRAFTIGMALALCGGGAAIAGTAYSKLSKRGKEAREREIKAALEDATPHTYADPDNPSVTGTAVAQPTLVEGNQECRIVEDRIAPDEALVKYCRPADGSGKWAVKRI